MMNKEFNTLYIQGYTAALMDVLKVMEDVQGDLKHHKRKQNYKTYKGIVKCMLLNRSILRENPDAFVRCNDKVDNGFEIYIQDKGVYDHNTRRVINNKE